MNVTRTIEKELYRQVNKDNILLLIGARQVGKTTLLRATKRHLESQGRNAESFTLEDPSLLADLNEHPENIFRYINKESDSKCYLLLDEIQYLDNPSNFLKYVYDQYNDKIKIIATGSSAFYIDKKFSDSLAGRKRILNIYPFSFSEFLRSKNEDKLADKVNVSGYLKSQKKLNLLKPQKKKLELFWQEYTTFGGYPKIVLERDLKEKQDLLKELHQSLLKKDISEAGVKDESKFYVLLKILASQCGELTNYNELANTVGLSHTAVRHFIHILQKSFILRTMTPLHMNLRKELTKMPKVFMYDPGYRNSLLNSFEMIERRTDSGSTLENIFFSEVVKSGVEDIRFWRTQDKKEVDFILDEKSAFEIKIQASKFKHNKYKKFAETYPGISLQPVVLKDESCLEVMDFCS